MTVIDCFHYTPPTFDHDVCPLDAFVVINPRGAILLLPQCPVAGGHGLYHEAVFIAVAGWQGQKTCGRCRTYHARPGSPILCKLSPMWIVGASISLRQFIITGYLAGLVPGPGR